MTEKNQLDQSPEGSKKQDGTKDGILDTILEKPSDKEDIVDLTEVAADASGPDDDIIDLFEKAGPEFEMEDELDIDLEDDLIDLTDVAMEKTEADDDIIDLLDDAETNIDIGEDIIDLAEITDDFKDRNTTTDARIVEQNSLLDNDFVDSMGMDLGTVSEKINRPVDADLENETSIEDISISLDPEDTSLPPNFLDTNTGREDVFKTQTKEKAPLDLSGIPAGQLEEILKRIVDELFSEKIEQMLATFIEKAVAREIERLKDLLLESPPDT